MLRIIPGTTAAAAIAYFKNGLRREDYYAKELLVPSKWHGKAAEKLELSGEVTAKQFAALADNKNPHSGKRLTCRQGNEQGRLPGWDFNFHAPKSLSLLQGLTGDPDLVRAFRSAVAETMGEIEKMIATRVRLNGAQEDRIAGNCLWAEFVHFTARPINGIPDPHLHTHAWVFNACFDEVEDRWKAVKIHDIKVDAPYFQAVFHSKLAKLIGDLGYSIRRTRDAWEIAGIAKAVLDAYSRRTSEIEAIAAKLGITDAKLKAELGAKTRKGKQGDLTRKQIMEEWRARLNPEDRRILANLYQNKPAPANSVKITPAEALDFAEKKVFENQSVVRHSKLLIEALKFGVGHTTLEGLQGEILRRGHIQRKVDGNHLVTTVPILLEEAQLIQRVRDGLGKLAPLQPGRMRYGRDFLSPEQKAAVRRILKSNDQVIALRGKAGTGKTTLLQEVRDQIEAKGMRLFAFAPSAEASRGVLRKESFAGANTVAHLLANKELQMKCRGNVILIDEAGTVGIRDLAKIMEIAGISTRVILAGDTGQHAPVPRGDILRLLEKYAGLRVATLQQIFRQEGVGYRKAVAALADHDLKTAFATLDQLGAIREIADPEMRYSQLAADYKQCLADTGKAPLVVSPTHFEAKSVTTAIRSMLVAEGKLGSDREFLQYRALQWEAVEKGKAENYSGGLAVKFHQNAPGIKRGSLLPVHSVEQDGTIWLKGSGDVLSKLDLKFSDRFRVFEIDKIAVAKGDALKITENSTSADGRRMNNGSTYTVKSIARDGTVSLSNGMKLHPEFGHFTHGYCQTSHSSQGKTVRTVFIAQSASSFLASSREGFYVSVSRGKENLRIYTDDRVALQKAVGNSSQRLSALEFTQLGDLLSMNGGLSGTEWTKRIAAERGGRPQYGSQVEKLTAQRKLEPQQKIKSFTSLLDMQRAKAGPDGKSRSKGHPQSLEKKGKGLKGITVPRRVEMRQSLIDKAAVKPDSVPEKKIAQTKAAVKKPELKDPRVRQATRAFKSMKNQLSEVVQRGSQGVEGAKNAASRKINFGNVKTTLGNLNSPKIQKAQVTQQATRPPAPKPKPPTPTPTIRRR